MFFGIAGLVVWSLMMGVPRLYNTIEGNNQGDRDYWTAPSFKVRYLAAIFALLLLGNLMPDRNTMYAIAASQVGEKLVKSDMATDATKALHQWIKKQIEPKEKS